ncbi:MULTISPECIES: Com family DNA-binding transcriptional regulator [Halopseudomonas]|uniref:Com family DNA-binding transcriptional regulator n=1 Tax=Halopseudomonas TaxID=2901189 RepID=UPI0022B68C54|nr:MULTISPECIES: Com family DNA-binding transcriptional regulator [Halopseudomonas]
MRIDLRCGHCDRKLATASGPYDLTIKCPRCKGMNQLKASSLPNRAPMSAASGVLDADSTNH